MGIVGHSGSGTLIALLLKNFKAGIGDIIIDNQSLFNSSRYYAFLSLSR
ncbi:hypothetical protein [Rickettsia montanensis]|nr:hypothetical protein [Rickettsia montanensis]